LLDWSTGNDSEVMMAIFRQLVSFDRLGDFWGVLREIDPSSAERDARRPVRVVICGRPGVGKRHLAAELSDGEASNPVVDVYDMTGDVPIALPDADAYIYLTSAAVQNPTAENDHLRQLGRRGSPVIVVVTDSDSADVAGLTERLAAVAGLDPQRVLALSVDRHEDIYSELIPALLRSAPTLALPLGRQMPAVRDQAADQLISETARVNAEFAALSSLPALIPIVGGLASAGADMIILTKNQVMLIMKLAIAHGRSVDNRLQVVTEMLPIIGAGFLWRTIARSLVALVPGPLAAAPKVAVAYVGTYVVGKAAQYYYRAGRRPSVDMLEHFQREAIDQLGALLPTISRLSKRIGPP
jgi:uncharacterized protein (DUF697 family)